jgi:hypothetical protein
MLLAVIYKVYLLKHIPVPTAFYIGELRSQPTPTFPMTLKSGSSWLLRCCAGVNVVCSRAECVFILKYYFTSNLLAAVHKAFSSVHLDKEIVNKTAIRRLVTKFQGQKVFACDLCWWSHKAAKVTAIRCNKGIWLQEFSIAMYSFFL